MDNRRVLLLLVVVVAATANTYPILLASYPADTRDGVHAGVYIQEIPDLSESPLLEAAVSVIVPTLPTHRTDTVRLRGSFTVNWRCSPLRPGSQFLPPVEATLRVFDNTFECPDGRSALCPREHPIATFPLNLTSVLATDYPPSRHGTSVALRIPLHIELPHVVAQAWVQLGVIWFAPLVHMPRYSEGSEQRNEVRWVASPGSTPPEWETSYAVRDSRDILIQGWTNWTTHRFETDRYFSFMHQPPALALDAYLDSPPALPPVHPPVPTSSIPPTANGTTTGVVVRPPWLQPVAPVGSPPVEPPAPLPPHRELFTVPAIVVAVIESLVIPSCLALAYTAGREKRYDTDVPIGKYLDALDRGHYASDIDVDSSDNDSMADLVGLDESSDSTYARGAFE